MPIVWWPRWGLWGVGGRTDVPRPRYMHVLTGIPGLDEWKESRLQCMFVFTRLCRP